jgi:hypothetical protein
VAESGCAWVCWKSAFAGTRCYSHKLVGWSLVSFYKILTAFLKCAAVQTFVSHSWFITNDCPAFVIMVQTAAFRADKSSRISGPRVYRSLAVETACLATDFAGEKGRWHLGHVLDAFKPKSCGKSEAGKLRRVFLLLFLSTAILRVARDGALHFWLDLYLGLFGASTARRWARESFPHQWHLAFDRGQSTCWLPFSPPS